MFKMDFESSTYKLPSIRHRTLTWQDAHQMDGVLSSPQRRISKNRTESEWKACLPWRTWSRGEGKVYERREIDTGGRDVEGSGSSLHQMYVVWRTASSKLCSRYGTCIKFDVKLGPFHSRMKDYDYVHALVSIPRR